MKKRSRIVFPLGVAFVLSIIIIFNSFNKSNSLEEDINLKNTIINNIEFKNQIAFSEITDFEWDRMFIFAPYSNPNDILKSKGIVTSNKSYNIEAIDSINMIAFTNSTELISFIELPREFIGIDIIGYEEFSKDKSNFKISIDTKSIVCDNTFSK